MVTQWVKWGATVEQAQPNIITTTALVTYDTNQSLEHNEETTKDKIEPAVAIINISKVLSEQAGQDCPVETGTFPSPGMIGEGVLS